ncbi:helix-turn-helix transcriptional regulator [Kitasatospora sp. NPDC059571]|uniref:helix-turn-helix transcriptional regulator n=1 Tax=Kitasatospora sp. NPDC059571 TaxID=3346871 RepID=UPI00369BC276
MSAQEASMLGAIGLDERAERLYTDLVVHGAGAPDELASRCGTGGAETRAALAALAEHGLIAPQREGSARYSAAPPTVALEALLTGRRHALRQAELAAAALAEAYRTAGGDGGHGDLVEVVAGRDAIGHRVAQLQAGAVEELLALVTGRYDVVRADATGAETAAVERGVHYRVVLERQALDRPGAAAALFEAMDREQQVRVVEEVPTKLIVADRAAALVPLTEGAAGGEPVALVVRAPALVRVLTVLFEQTWEWAHPLGRDDEAVTVGAAPAGEPDGVDRRILALLLAGATDQAAANQLGLGLRTVQRRISRLMSLARAETRIQLGWQAHRRGWVPD